MKMKIRNRMKRN